jgi:hypothetical protein
VSITSKCREASVAKQVSRCREASVAKQVSRCREASVAKQVSRSNCGKASVEASVRSKCCEASVAKQPVAKRGATCRADKKRRNNSSPETIAFNRKTNGDVWLSQPKTTMCSLRTTCFLLLLVVFRWHPIDVTFFYTATAPPRPAPPRSAPPRAAPPAPRRLRRAACAAPPAPRRLRRAAHAAPPRAAPPRPAPPRTAPPRPREAVSLRRAALRL